MRIVKRSVATLIALGAMMGMFATTQAQAAPYTCPSTFQVLHNDQIGKLKLPAGAYYINVFDKSKLSCDRASDRFRQFLADYDGNLPGKWRVNASNASFTRGGGVGFSVSQSDNSNGGGGDRKPVSGKCPGSFHVLHNDYIGKLYLPNGYYRITLRAPQGPISCSRASTLFAMFLQDYDGNLPGRWWVNTKTATFRRGSHNVGFRVKKIGAKPDNGGNGGSGKPSGRRCPGTFRVLHNDRIGGLKFPAGNYWLTLLPAKRQIGCNRASRLMTIFLDHSSGDLPGKWVVNVHRGAFTKGKNSNVGFRAKPTFGTRN